VKETLAIAFALVVFIIFISRPGDRHVDSRDRTSAVTAADVIAMQVLGYSLDNLSLMALTLAIGFLVDDAIVFLENTARLMEEDRTPWGRR